MRIEFNPYLFLTPRVSGVKFNSRVNYTNFGNVQPRDTFQYTFADPFFNEKFIRSMIESNDDLKKFLKNNNVSARLNMKELEDLKNNHMHTTRDVCERIAANLPKSLKDSVNMKDLKEAAMLHDFGKVLIPSEILNKNGALTPDEYNVMKLHSELGYQLLKKTNLNENVLNLIRNHHNNLDADKNFIYDVDLQILNLADKYSALTEKRVYKKALDSNQALTILAAEVRDGKVHPQLFNALVKAVNSNPFANSETVKYATNIA